MVSVIYKSLKKFYKEYLSVKSNLFILEAHFPSENKELMVQTFLAHLRPIVPEYNYTLEYRYLIG